MVYISISTIVQDSIFVPLNLYIFLQLDDVNLSLFSQIILYVYAE